MHECPYKIRIKSDDVFQDALYIVKHYTVTGCSKFLRLEEGLAYFSVKGQRVKISRFAALQFLLLPLRSTVIVHKQPLIIYKQMGCLDLAHGL